MKITFALPGLNNLSGGLRVVSQYTRHLLEQGHEIVFAVRRPAYIPGRKEKVRNLLGLGRRIPALPPERGHFSGLDVSVVHLDEARAVRKNDLPDADLIISTWWSTAEWAALLPRSKGKHVHFIQGYEDFEPFYQKRLNAVYRQDNAKIVVASWLSKLMDAQFGRGSTVVNNGVDTAFFSTPARQRNHPARIGAVYSSHPCKNVSLSLAAMARVHQADPEIEMIMFGSEERPATLPAYISYHHRPEQHLIPQLYASCDLWLFVSESEGFGLPILEAMASRTPVLATPSAAAPDLIDGSNGQLSTFDEEGYAGAILDFLALTDDAWVTASDAAWHTAQKNDVRFAAQSFEDALKRIIEHA